MYHWHPLLVRNLVGSPSTALLRSALQLGVLQIEVTSADRAETPQISLCAHADCCLDSHVLEHMHLRYYSRAEGVVLLLMCAGWS